jgi:hypothetical protein
LRRSDPYAEAVNREGHPETLVAAHPGNANALRYGVFSERLRDPRAREIADAIMEQPHTTAVDELGAIEIGKLVALLEAVDSDIAERGVTKRNGDLRAVVDLRLRASRRLAEWLDRYGLTPQGRAAWAATFAQGGLAGEISRRRAELDVPPRS